MKFWVTRTPIELGPAGGDPPLTRSDGEIAKTTK